MADGFDVHLTGDEAFQAKLEKVSALLADMRLFMPYLVPVFIGWMRSAFESQGAWSGTPWAPLSPAYAAEKSHSHPGRSILIREGGLRQAASRPRREVTPRTLTLWIDDETAVWHQDGTSHMPARPLVPSPLPPAALRDIDLAAEEHVHTLIRSVGL
jgi:hypothetical protein